MKIYFNQKTFHRERQSDTVKSASIFFDVITPLKNNVDNIKTFCKQPLYLKVISYLVNKIPLINLRRISKLSETADYIYTWWDIPLFSKKPFIIELDNPYILTFYNYFAFRIYKLILRKLLLSNRCKKIVCISEACKNTLIDEFGDKILNKTQVLYPRINNKNNINNDDKIIKFLFVWFSWRYKWVMELLESFTNIQNSNIRLNIIWFNDPIIKNKYKKDKRIVFLWKKQRNEILEKYMIEHDVLVFPTYYESFWMVALESLSRWLWIITTNVYALPEIVVDWFNWKLINHPYLKKNKLWYIEVRDFLWVNFNKYNLNQKFISDISWSIESAISDYKTWKDNSGKLFNERFSEKVWEESFLNIFK